MLIPLLVYANCLVETAYIPLRLSPVLNHALHFTFGFCFLNHIGFLVIPTLRQVLFHTSQLRA